MLKSRNRWSLYFNAAFVGIAVVWGSAAHAIAPRYVSDSELASYPIVVIAKWEKADVTGHHQTRTDQELGEVIIKSESYTRLNILSVVKGAADPGVNELLIVPGISWQNDGTFVNSGTSTEMVGDVSDITNPCLWFLKRNFSWDKAIKNHFLSVSNYREVQPIELKEYYLTMARADSAVEVPKLLTTESSIVAKRVLSFVCGGKSPWPYHEDEFDYDDRINKLQGREGKRYEPLRAEADRVWKFLSSGLPELRQFAAGAYAEISGESGLSNIRTLLDDENPEVRGIAVGALAHRRDEPSAGRFAKALDGLKDATIARHVIDALASWKDDIVVAPLISFLQNDGDAWANPALKARQALFAITGHQFPFHVMRSRTAWEAAIVLDDKSARKRLLEQSAPGNQSPVVATAVGLPRKELGQSLKRYIGRFGKDDTVVTIRLRNVSHVPVTILKLPSVATMHWPAGVAGVRTGINGDAEKPQFTTLKSNEAFEFDAILKEGFLIAKPEKRELVLEYLKLGSPREDGEAWMGNVAVEFGAEWKEKRDVKFVEETWPNGNLKATGNLVNGKKLGEWNYFNEQGDRVRIEYPGTGRGTAESNPEHPTNTGAGKRP